MPYAKIVKSKVWEDSAVYLMARVVGRDAAVLTQSDISSITARFYAVDTETEIISDVSLTPSSVLFNSLQTDAKWTVDSTGYNFGYLAPKTAFAGVDSIRVDIEFTPSSGGAAESFPVVWEFDITGRKG